MACLPHNRWALACLPHPCRADDSLLYSGVTGEAKELHGKWGIRFNAAGWAYLVPASGVSAASQWVKDHLAST
eukprot:449994-Alexandrium_andersonii.AAC.1